MSDLESLLAELAAEGVCVKVGTWCSALLTQAGRTLPLLPKPVTYHAELTPLAAPAMWGFTYQGWGDDPVAALRAAIERRAELEAAG